MMLTTDAQGKVHIHKAPARFRRVPVAKAFDATNERERRCHELRGHTLAVTDDKIVCTDCGAEWCDYGC